MSNVIRNVLLAGAVVLSAASFGQVAQASSFDILEVGGYSVELGDLDLEDISYADVEEDDNEDESEFEEVDDDDEEDDE